MAREAASGATERPVRWWILTALCVPLAFGTVHATESPDGAPPLALPAHLTLDEAVRIFRARGFDLLLADAATAQARGDLTAARAFPNPLISAGGGHSFTYDPSRCAGCSASLVTAGVSDQGLLADLFVGKRRLRIDVAREALDAAERSRSDAERTLLALLKQQYTATVLARELRAFAERPPAHSTRPRRWWRRGDARATPRRQTWPARRRRSSRRSRRSTRRRSSSRRRVRSSPISWQCAAPHRPSKSTTRSRPRSRRARSARPTPTRSSSSPKRTAPTSRPPLRSCAAPKRASRWRDANASRTSPWWPATSGREPARSPSSRRPRRSA